MFIGILAEELIPRNLSAWKKSFSRKAHEQGVYEKAETSEGFLGQFFIIYVIYYTVIIVQDLYGKPKDEKSQGESFDVSDMTDEEESIAVSESDGGFSVGDNQYETAYEEKQLAEPTEEAAATAEESKPHVLEKIQSAIEKKMEEVNTTYSDPMYSEELNNTIIARGLRHNGRDMVKVESLNNEI